jgi:hypothetical protein
MERKPFERRFEDIKSEATTWVAGWKDIRSYIAPTCGFFDGDQPNDGKKLDHKNIIDDHASRQLEILANGLSSGLCDPSRPWFKLGLPDPDMMKYQAIKEWLDVVQARMFAVFAKSNFYEVFNAIFYEMGGFATGCAIFTEDRMDVIRGRNFTIGEYFLGTGPDNRVDTFGREYQATVGQLVREFGKASVSDQVRRLYEEGKVDKWVQCRHLIEPNDTRILERGDFRGMAYRSVYWEVNSPADTFLRVKGFEEFPVIAPRWKKIKSSDIYGRRSPGWNTLGDVKMLQKMQKKGLTALDKMVDPPIQADSHVEHVNLLPGGVTRSSSMLPNAGVRPAYQVQPDFDGMENKIEKIHRAIASGFFSDLFMMINSLPSASDKTAFEIAKRNEEALRILGPVITSIGDEALDPSIDRTFSIMARVGLIPEPPDVIQGQPLNIEYISPLAQAQKMIGTAGIQNTVAFVGNIAGVYPEVKDIIDADEAVREYADMHGIPAKILRSEDEVVKIRKQREEDIEKAKAAQDAGAAIQGAKLLSETRLNQGSVLDALAGGV